jgi:hypothetical protein
MRVIILSCGVGTLVRGCRLPSARAPEEHLDLVTGSPELIRRAMVHPDRTELPGKHRPCIR